MRAYLTLLRRELAVYFLNLIGYVIIATTAFLTGLSLAVMLIKLEGLSTPLPVTQLFYATPFFWLIVLLSAPIITMRLFAQEKSSGTFETLMTAPVSDLQVLLAKFSAAWIFYLTMWLPLLASLLILNRYTSETAALNGGTLGGMFLGISLIGAAFMALGCLSSALTRSQIISGMTCLAGGLSLFLLSFLNEKLSLDNGFWVSVFNCLSMFEHMNDFARGIVDTRALVFYLSITVIFLFLALRVLESRRWK